MRPVPMAATLMRLLGAFFPSTDAGIIVGKPLTSADEANVPLVARSINFRRETVDFFGEDMIGNVQGIFLSSTKL